MVVSVKANSEESVRWSPVLHLQHVSRQLSFISLHCAHCGKFPPEKFLSKVTAGKESVTRDIVTLKSSSHMEDQMFSLVSLRDATRSFACVTL